VDTDTYNNLTKIKNERKEKVFGQICQNFLALALSYIFPPEKIEVRNVEGVDIVIDDQTNKYAIEVKTTSKNAINFSKKDYKGLQNYRCRNYKAILAVLKLDMHSEWIFKSADKLNSSGSKQVGELYTDEEYKDLARKVQEKFEEIVNKNSLNILSNGENYLIRLLKEKGLKYSGE